MSARLASCSQSESFQELLDSSCLLHVSMGTLTALLSSCDVHRGIELVTGGRTKLAVNSPQRQDGEEDGLLVDVPAEHEGAQSAEQQAAQETSSTARTPPDGRYRRLQRGRGQTEKIKVTDYRRINLRIRWKLCFKSRLSSFVLTHQDGEKSADESDGGRDGREDRVVDLLNQAARHGGSRKLRLVQQLQTNAWKQTN